MQPSHESHYSSTSTNIHINFHNILFKLVPLHIHTYNILFLVHGVQASWNTEDDASCILLPQAIHPSAYGTSNQGVIWAAGDLESCVRL